MGAAGIPKGAPREKGLQGCVKRQGAEGALDVSPSARTFRLFMIEVTLNQTVGNWYDLITIIHCIMNLLTVQLLNLVSYFTVMFIP
jgi:hypothetical protein